MDQMRNHPLNVSDENFYKVTMNELSNIEAYLKPQFHQILQKRSKINILRASFVAKVVPQMIQFKEIAEKQNLMEMETKINELEQLYKSLEERSNNSTMSISSLPNP